MATTPSVPLPSDVYVVFAGNIDQAALERIFQGFNAAFNNGIKNFHLLLQSSGGGIGDGVCLYNFFKSLTMDLTIYNCGTVASIAAIAYLGAKRRKVSAHASFMLHRTQTTTQSANTSSIKALAESAVLNDQITETILRDNLNLPEDKWTELDRNDLFFTAQQSVEYGFAHEIGEFAPPVGTRIYTL